MLIYLIDDDWVETIFEIDDRKRRIFFEMRNRDVSATLNVFKKFDWFLNRFEVVVIDTKNLRWFENSFSNVKNVFRWFADFLSNVENVFSFAVVNAFANVFNFVVINVFANVFSFVVINAFANVFNSMIIDVFENVFSWVIINVVENVFDFVVIDVVKNVFDFVIINVVEVFFNCVNSFFFDKKNFDSFDKRFLKIVNVVFDIFWFFVNIDLIMLEIDLKFFSTSWELVCLMILILILFWIVFIDWICWKIKWNWLLNGNNEIKKYLQFCLSRHRLKNRKTIFYFRYRWMCLNFFCVDCEWISCLRARFLNILTFAYDSIDLKCEF